MKLQPLARSFPADARRMLRFLLGFTTLITPALLSAAALPSQTIHLPATFEQNRGQAPAGVQWLGRGSNYLLLFGEDGVTFLLPDKNDLQAIAERRSARIGHSLPGQALQRKYNVIQMKLERSHPWTGITGDGLTAGVSNYLQPGDEKAEIRGIPQYERVKVPDVYKGIDLLFRISGDHLEYDFDLGPGADPAQIQMDFKGMKTMQVDEKSGDLVLTMQDGSHLRQPRPNVYQQLADRRIKVDAGFRMLGPGRAAFTLARYDRSRPLTIDPTLV